MNLIRHLKDLKQGKTTLTLPRSSHWKKVEKKQLEKEPNCRACGTSGGVQVHHIFPFHYCIALGRPDLELDLRNLVTLCESNKEHSEQNHHLLLGHYDDFQSSNLDVLRDIITFKGMDAQSIRESSIWLERKKGTLKPLHLMTDQDKQDFIQRMNSTYPLIR